MLESQGPAAGRALLDLGRLVPVTVVLLIGAGHAHLYAVRHAAELVAAGYRGVS